ncbi:MAG: SRPBCC family protein [Candidatus Kapaibacterium sp.]
MSQTDFVVDREKLEVRISRMFDAPRDLVFKACTDPAMIPQWWGPRRFTTTVDKMDVKVGGVWRFIQHDTEGNEFAFNGVYKEIVPPERVVQTFEFEPMAGHILTETVTFEAMTEGTTKMSVVVAYGTIQDLDGMVASGMKDGLFESHDRLAQLVENVPSFE